MENDRPSGVIIDDSFTNLNSQHMTHLGNIICLTWCMLLNSEITDISDNKQSTACSICANSALLVISWYRLPIIRYNELFLKFSDMISDRHHAVCNN